MKYATARGSRRVLLAKITRDVSPCREESFFLRIDFVLIVRVFMYDKLGATYASTASNPSE